MEKIVEEGGERPVDVRLLAAFVAIGPRQRRAAIEAGPLVGMAVGRFTGIGFDRAAENAAGDRIAQCFEFPHAATLCEHPASC
jgi:hypothetical protein